MLAYLSDRGVADFTELASALEIANNTLSGHLQRLEDAAYVELGRGFFNRKPRTRVTVTPLGREAWRAHLAKLE
ncbi:transcriptional regulator [Brevundimonas sp.]|uniref:transcriptional regulator n=1 Tax=Brevundimonas sp. TaxID=1871086 RepID=UPI002D62268F|nr:transcriptional regulator [Brevundimonas sp.]HYC68839.1 transcriptional regulator [Brevundimonas sp.]